MKTKVLKSLILIGIFFLVAGCDSEVPNLQGEWMAVDKKTPYKVVITDNIFQIQIYQVENTTDSNPKELAPVVEDAAEEIASMLLTDLSYLTLYKRICKCIIPWYKMLRYICTCPMHCACLCTPHPHAQNPQANTLCKST